MFICGYFMNLAQLETQVWTLLDDPQGVYYPGVRGALNEAQRFFCLLTLCLEKTVSFPLTAGTTFYHARATYFDWLVPRRILNSLGQRMRPSKLGELDALSATWEATPGAPLRYSHTGLDFLAITPQPPVADTLAVTYAAAPPLLKNLTDTPVIPETSHFALANYAAYALRLPEGGQEFSKFLGYFNDFLDEAQRMQQLVRAKNLDTRYERMPFELERMDRSRLLAA